MRRREILKTTAVVSAALAAPRIGRVESAKVATFCPHADLAPLDPVWTTPDAPLGMHDQTTAFNKRITDVPEGWPQFYGLQKNS